MYLFYNSHNLTEQGLSVRCFDSNIFFLTRLIKSEVATLQTLYNTGYRYVLKYYKGFAVIVKAFMHTT